MAGGKSNKSRRKSQAVKIAETNARLAKAQAKRVYKDHVKTMRPYLKKLRKIDLRKNVTSGQRSFITKAYKEFTELTTRPVKIIRPRSKARLQAYQDFSGQRGTTKFDVAFYPAASPKAKVKLTKTKRGYRIREDYAGVRKEKLLFVIKDLAADPDKEIARVLSYTSSELFIIKVGAFLYNGGLSRSLVPAAVKKLMMAYNDPTANNFYQNWLEGLEAYEGTDRDIDAERAEYKAGSDAKKAQKAAERRKTATLKRKARDAALDLRDAKAKAKRDAAKTKPKRPSKRAK